MVISSDVLALTMKSLLLQVIFRMLDMGHACPQTVHQSEMVLSISRYIHTDDKYDQFPVRGPLRPRS
jgi:hypothetical protein